MAEKGDEVAEEVEELKSEDSRRTMIDQAKD